MKTSRTVLISALALSGALLVGCGDDQAEEGALEPAPQTETDPASPAGDGATPPPPAPETEGDPGSDPAASQGGGTMTPPPQTEGDPANPDDIQGAPESPPPEEN